MPHLHIKSRDRLSSHKMSQTSAIISINQWESIFRLLTVSSTHIAESLHTTCLHTSQQKRKHIKLTCHMWLKSWTLGLKNLCPHMDYQLFRIGTQGMSSLCKSTHRFLTLALLFGILWTLPQTTKLTKQKIRPITMSLRGKTHCRRNFPSKGSIAKKTTLRNT